MRNEAKDGPDVLTDEQLEALFDRLGAGCTIDDVAFTRDTFEQLEAARTSWSNPGKRSRVDAIDIGYNGLVYRGAQIRRGLAVCNFYAIDFGTMRAVVTL